VRLRDTHLIRVACVFALLISVVGPSSRPSWSIGTTCSWQLRVHPRQFPDLTAITFSPVREGYCRWPRTVPARNVVVAAYVAHTQRRQLEMLMLLPVLLLGPMFLLDSLTRAVLCAFDSRGVRGLAVYFHLPLATAAARMHSCS